MIEAIGAFGPQYIDATTAIKASSESLLLPERTGAVYKVFKDEIAEADTKEKATASMILGAFVLEQGPINEIASALITTSVLNATGNPVTSGIIGGLSYAIQQGVYGLATAKGTTAIPKTEQEYHTQFPSKEEEIARTLWKKYKVLFFLGMSALVVNEHMQNEDQSVKKDAKLIRNWMPTLIATDLAVFYGASYVIDNAERFGVDPNAITDILTNPFTYFAAFGLLKYKEHYTKYRNNLRESDDEIEEEPSFIDKVKERFSNLKRKKNTETLELSDTIVVDE